MIRRKKQYATPRHPWQAERIVEEEDLVRRYGLKNKKEVWRAQSTLRNWRAQARKLVGLSEKERIESQKLLFDKLIKLGLLTKTAGVDDVLDLNIEQILGLRLQTVAHNRSLASTPKQARQFIVHGKVLVNGEVVTAPSYMTKANDKIEFVKGFKPFKGAVAPKKKEEEKPAEVPEEKPAESVAEEATEEVKNG